MPLNDSRTQRLTEILAQENAKKGYHPGFSSSKFRETALDTHESLPPQYFGPPRLPTADRLAYRSPSVGTLLRDESRARKVASASARLSHEEPEFSSVFKPTAEQAHVVGLAATRRNLIATSEWAMLDALEIELVEHERRQQAKLQSEQRVTMRHNLDAQVRTREIQNHLERMEEMKASEDMLMGTARLRVEESRRAEASKQRVTQVLSGRDAQVAARAASRTQAYEDKMAEEQLIIARDKEALEKARQASQEKAAARRAQVAGELADVEARRAEVSAAAIARRAQDEELVINNIRALERQEAERIKARTEKLARDDRRQALVAEKIMPNSFAAEKLAEDERRRQAAIDKAAADADAREAGRLAKKTAGKQMLSAEHQAFMARKQREQQEATAQMQREKMLAVEQAAADRAAQDAQLRAIRARADTHAGILTTQRFERETVNVTSDVGMSEQERLINRRLLDQARQVAVRTGY